jgi:iron(III) transport system ATP-binding protein
MSIGIKGLEVRYQDKPVIQDLALEVEGGQLFTLLGPSGCGKTTLLRTLAGFIAASQGEIRFSGRDVTHVPPHLRDIGMVFQDYALFPDKTVEGNVGYGLRARNVGAADITRRVGEALERVGLDGLGARLPAALSGGQRQRVALARALVIRPSVLLMDEPLSNLDARLRVQVRETIAQLQAEAGITTVFVTHDQEEALAISHRIGIMAGGRIEQVGTPDTLYREPVSAYVAGFVGAANLLQVALAQAANKGDMATVPLGTGQIAAKAVADLPAGRATLMLRPEALSLAAVDSASRGVGALHGTVTARQYLGASTRYTVQLAGTPAGTAAGSAGEVHAACHGAGHNAHAVGQAVAVLVQAGEARLLPA